MLRFVAGNGLAMYYFPTVSMHPLLVLSKDLSSYWTPPDKKQIPQLAFCKVLMVLAALTMPHRRAKSLVVGTFSMGIWAKNCK